MLLVITPTESAATEPWLSTEELGTWITFTSMLVILPATIDARLKRDAGMNFFEYTIMAGLSEAPARTMQMATLAKLAAGSASRLSHAVTRLERQGWVHRHTYTVGPRRTDVILTDAGFAVLTAAAPEHAREARRLVVDALTPEQLHQLRLISRRLLYAAAPAAAPFFDEIAGNSAEPAGQ